MKDPEEVNLSREDGAALIERLENNALTTHDRHILKELITLHFSHRLAEALDLRETRFTAPVGVASSKRAKHKKAMRSDTIRPATKALIEIVHHKPNIYGINRSNWSYQSLADAFEKQYGLRISPTTVSQLLKEAGYRWKKSRKVFTSPDPHYREKGELLLSTLQSLQSDELLFFIDELGPVQVKRHGGRRYTPGVIAPFPKLTSLDVGTHKGSSPTVWHNERNQRVVAMQACHHFSAYGPASSPLAWDPGLYSQTIFLARI
jgi:transposase